MHNFKIWYVVLRAKHLVYSEPCGNFFKIISSSTGLTEQTWVIPFLECINSLFLTQQMKKAGPKQLTSFYLVTGSSYKAGDRLWGSTPTTRWWHQLRDGCVSLWLSYYQYGVFLFDVGILELFFHIDDSS